MTGNEVGILLLNFIAQCKTELGTMPKDPVAVTTIVSTDMVNGIAKDYGIEIRRTLTGFKYIGDQIALIESEGHRSAICSALKRATATSPAAMCAIRTPWTAA